VAGVEQTPREKVVSEGEYGEIRDNNFLCFSITLREIDRFRDRPRLNSNPDEEAVRWKRDQSEFPTRVSGETNGVSSEKVVSK
jgi:hypothetical protein